MVSRLLHEYYEAIAQYDESLLAFVTPPLFDFAKIIY